MALRHRVAEQPEDPEGGKELRISAQVARRRHADREAAWRNLRTSGYLGLCITEHRTGNPLRAREYCRRAVDYDERNPIAHFLLGNIIPGPVQRLQITGIARQLRC